MEKRLFFAIIVSFFILYGWSAIVQKPKQDERIKNQQLVENKSVIEQTSKAVPAATLPIEVKTDHFPEAITSIENEQLRISLSSRGGSVTEVFIKGYEELLPVVAIGNLPDDSVRDFSISSVTTDSIEYAYADENMRITKKYSLSSDEYVFRLDVTVERKKGFLDKDIESVNGFSLEMSKLDISSKKNQTANDKALFEYVVARKEDIFRKNNAFKFSSKENISNGGEIRWAGFRNRYFCLIVKPLFKTSDYIITSLSEKDLAVRFKSGITAEQEQGGQQFSFFVFAGPEKLDILKKFNFEFEKIKRYYRWQLLDGIAKLIYEIMQFIFRFVHNWGLCVIIMSTLIYFSMYPLTMKSLLSMKKMQALQPKMAAIKEKHANNPQKMNQEIMELYKKNKINPLGGCLPMLLQMPVFIGLYQVLWRSVDFSGASFLWIKDLSQPDRLYVLSSSLPVLGNEINILPILMIVVMFLQQKMTAKNMVFTDPAQESQQKMMTFILPIFLGMIFYHFASGLTLYFLMFYLFSALTQWTISQKPEVISHV